jgi:hypothetical protein
MQSTGYYCQILMKLEFRGQISKNNPISNFMKIRPLEAELFHADKQQDGRSKRNLKVTCRNFVNAPKNGEENLHKIVDKERI